MGMVFGYRFAKKGVVLLIIAALLVAALGIVAVAYGGSPDSAEADSAFVKEDEVVFAHITDTHYYSAAYCGDIAATCRGDIVDGRAVAHPACYTAAPYSDVGGIVCASGRADISSSTYVGVCMSSAFQSNLGVGHHAVVRQKSYKTTDSIGVTRHLIITSPEVNPCAFCSNIEISVDSQRTVVNSTGRCRRYYSACTGFFRIV